MDFNGTFFVAIISFIVFVYLMNKVLYEPVRNIVMQRNRFITENLSDADNNKKKTEMLINEREEKLFEAKNGAKLKYVSTLDEYKNKKNEILKNAQAEARTNIDNSNTELFNLSNEAKQVLKNDITNLASSIAEKILGYRSEIQGFDNDTIDEILYR